jgi:hypothetical protein
LGGRIYPPIATVSTPCQYRATTVETEGLEGPEWRGSMRR